MLIAFHKRFGKARRATMLSTPRILGPRGEFTVSVRGNVGKWMAWRLPSGTAVVIHSSLLLDLALIVRDWLRRRLAGGAA